MTTWDHWKGRFGMHNVPTMTRERYERIPESNRGRITHVYGEEDLIRPYLGRRTLIHRHRMLVEGIGFVIVD